MRSLAEGSGAEIAPEIDLSVYLRVSIIRDIKKGPLCQWYRLQEPRPCTVTLASHHESELINQ